MGRALDGAVTGRRAMPATIGRALLTLLGVATFVGLWHVAAVIDAGPGAVVPFPAEVARSLVERWAADELGRNLVASLTRVGLGFLVGALAGTVLGVLGGWSFVAERALFVPLDMVRYVPALAWVPLTILWIGLGETAKVFLVSLGAFFQLLLGSYAAVRRVDANLLRAGRSLGCDGPALLVRVVLPAILPELATACRIGMTLSYITVIGAELLGAREGLGYLMSLALEDGRPTLIFVSLTLFAASNLATDAALKRLFDHLLRWHAGLQAART